MGPDSMEQEVERLRGVLALIAAAPEHAHGYATAALSVESPPPNQEAVEAFDDMVDRGVRALYAHWQRNRNGTTAREDVRVVLQACVPESERRQETE